MAPFRPCPIRILSDGSFNSCDGAPDEGSNSYRTGSCLLATAVDVPSVPPGASKCVFVMRLRQYVQGLGHKSRCSTRLTVCLIMGTTVHLSCHLRKDFVQHIQSQTLSNVCTPDQLSSGGSGRPKLVG